MIETSLLITALVALLAVGAFAGVMAGLLGVGGGIILVPAFFYVFTSLGFDSGYVMQICVATSLATIIVTSARSLNSHHKKGAVDWAILRSWAPWVFIGSLLGVALAAQLDSRALQLIFGVFGVVIGAYFGFGNPAWRLSETTPSGVVRAVLTTVIGGLSVILGIGGGSLAVPSMTLTATPIHRAVATGAGVGLLLSVPSVIGFLTVSIPGEVKPPYTIGAVNIPAFLVVISMTIITAPYGAALAHRLDAKRLRQVFAVFLMFVAVNMLREALF